MAFRRKQLQVSDACQINDFDHEFPRDYESYAVSDACQINDFDHVTWGVGGFNNVSDACQINDFDHNRCTWSR